MNDLGYLPLGFTLYLARGRQHPFVIYASISAPDLITASDNFTIENVGELC
jgi:hypothetical protein